MHNKVIAESDHFELQTDYSIKTDNYYTHLEVKGRFYIDAKNAALEQLLNIAIEKWDFIAKILDLNIHLHAEGGIYTCALCYAFHGVICRGCPVREYTKDIFCMSSPYYGFGRAISYGEWDRAKNIAHAELKFLKKLRKKLAGGWVPNGQ